MSGRPLGIILVLISVSIEALAQIALKKAALIPSHEPRHKLYSMCGISLFAVEAVVWTAVLSTLELSIAFPMGALSFVTTAIFSLLLLKEKIVPQRWIGILTIVVGTIFLGME
jgi:undecaprenyl phosphate-alpha-L-ara4N flippase subunit ArnE